MTGIRRCSQAQRNEEASENRQQDQFPHHHWFLSSEDLLHHNLMAMVLNRGNSARCTFLLKLVVRFDARTFSEPDMYLLASEDRPESGNRMLDNLGQSFSRFSTLARFPL